MNNHLNAIKNQLKLSPRLAITATFAITIVIQIVQGLFILPTLRYPVLMHVLLPLAFFACMLAVILMLMGWFKISISDLKRWILKPSRFSHLFIGIVLMFLVLPFAELSTTLIPTDTPFMNNWYSQFEESFEMMLNYKIAAFITVCILAPVLEEIVFRGILLRGMLNNRVNPVIAVVLSGVLFGLAHLNPWQFIGAGMLGIVFGFVYYRTQSLFICMLLHSINNTVSFAMMLKYQNVDEHVFDPTQLSLILVFLLLALALGYYFYKKTPKQIWN